MRYAKMICVMSSGVLLCACAPPQSSVDLGAEQADLRAAADAYHEAGQTVDIDSLIDLYTNDALILPPNAAEEKGLQGVRSFIDGFSQTPGFAIRFDDMTVEVAASGDMGYTLADAVISVEGPDGEPVRDRIRDFHLWKKQDGKWKVAIDISNSEIPLPGVDDTSEADREAISQLRQREIEAFSAGDVEALGSIFTEDAVLMPPNELGFQGAEARAVWLRGLYEEASVQGVYTGTELTLAGDWAFEQIAMTLTTTPVAGGVAVEEVGKALHVYRRQPDGSWKIALDIWNTDSPPASGQ